MAQMPRVVGDTSAAALAGLPEVGVGMIGYGFMGKAHSAAYHRTGRRVDVEY